MLLTLKIAILRSQKTQRSISIATEIPETRLSNIVRGRSTPDSAERARLAKALSVSEEQLFPEDCVYSVPQSPDRDAP